jgi:peptidyl-prolyl cis-trans isomerase A (cyclophilin A)
MGTVKIIIVLSITLLLSIPGAALSTTVRMQTSLGTFDVELFDDDAPQTVANFLNYVNSGAYNNSFFHRSMPDFVVQGGGFTWSSSTNLYSQVPTEAPVINEFSLDRSNLRGTIAMAKLGDDPNSATSQWFFNLGDNSDNLDNQNGGFTVFGRVKESGLEIMDAIGELQVVNAGGVFNNLPLVSFPPQGQTLQSENLVLINSVEVLPTIATSPNAPTLFYDLDGLNVNISWTEVPDASGYELYYAPYPYVGPETIGNHDVGDQTSQSFYLWRGAAYYIAVTAYNDAGESVYSNIEHFTMTPVP